MRPVSGLMTRAGGMNEDLRNAVSIHLRASLVPAAAVIPAQVAYFDVVAVKKLVVCWHPGLLWGTEGSSSFGKRMLDTLVGVLMCPPLNFSLPSPEVRDSGLHGLGIQVELTRISPSGVL